MMLMVAQKVRARARAFVLAPLLGASGLLPHELLLSGFRLRVEIIAFGWRDFASFVES